MSAVEQVIGSHPPHTHPCGLHFIATDQKTPLNVSHRILDDEPLHLDEFIAVMRQWLVNHHVSPEAIERDRILREAMARQGFQDYVKRFPENLTTQKGNWAEILLTEYIVASSNTRLPIYRLRVNPNPDQSMKGDDVLVFDLDSNPVRILIGEAKFRKTSTKTVVNEIINALENSRSGGLPSSLQFVADLLCMSGNKELGEKVADCNMLFAQDQLRLDYVGLLVSDKDAHRHVIRNAKSEIPDLVVISLGLENPEGVVTASYENLET